MRFTKAILISAASLLLPLMSQATPVSTNPVLSIGGLTFNDFGCAVTQHGMSSGGGCGDIDVSTITHPGTGINFASSFSALSLGESSFDDARISYHVTSAPDKYISGVGLDFDGFFYGYAITSVTETVFDKAGNLVGHAQAVCGVVTGCKWYENIGLNGLYSDLYIQKDINVSSYFVGYGNISNIDQTFATVPTPEPGSLAMLGAGLLGVAGLLRRRSKLAAVKAENNA